MLKAKLVVVGGDAKSAEVSLKLPTVIGRGKEANLTVPHALVSRRHTEIFEKDGKLYARDMGSLNGTFVNNQKIEGDTLLEPNQLLTLGNITFRAVYEIEVSSEAKSAGPDSETITFDEVKTEVTPSVEKKKANDLVNPVVAATEEVDSAPVEFTETVPVDDLEKATPAKQDAAEQAEESDEFGELSEEPVFEADESTGESDTDKSFKVEGEESLSSIFDFDEEEGNASKSIAVNALEDLPSAQPAAVSFVGKVDFGDDVATPTASAVDPIEIDLGDEKKPTQQDDGDSGLGSFLNKLPR